MTALSKNRALGNRATGFISVKDFGATGDGVTDDYAAIQEAIDAVPDNDTSWSTIGRATGGNEIYFPDTASAYVIGTKLNVPTTKSIRFVGPGAFMVRLKYTGAGDYAFNVDGAQRSTSFEFFMFDGGGIEWEGGSRLNNQVRNCFFDGISDYAIKTLGASCISFEIYNCFFSECAGGISIGFQDSDLWNINKCSFVRNSGVDIHIKTSGVKVEWCDFETRTVANTDKPNIHIEEGFLANSIEYNRFGDEVISTTHSPPAYNIVIGPLVGTSTTSSNTHRITNNDFRGTNGTPSATEAAAAIRLACPLYDSQIVHNSFQIEDFYFALVEEAFFDNTAPAADRLYGNLWDNTVSSRGEFIAMSKGGVGWDVRSNDKANSNERLVTNYLRSGEDMAASGLWIDSAAMTTTKAGTGPDGTSSAFTLTKASGSANVRSAGSPTLGAGDYTFSVMAQAGSLDRIRIYVLNGSNEKLSSSLKTIVLDSEWNLYYVNLKNVAAATTATCYIAVGHDNDSAATGTVLVAEPQLHEGLDPVAYISSLANTHAARQRNGLSIGAAHHGFGTAAPVASRYEVGDVVWDTAPTAGGTMGWVCTTAGSPGTWKTFGAITA